MNYQERKRIGTELQPVKGQEKKCERCSKLVEVGKNMFQLIAENTENEWVDVQVSKIQLVCRDCAAENQVDDVSGEEAQKRIKLAKAYLAEIGNSHTFRKEIEEAEKENNLDAYWKLENKLARELSEHLIRYKGSSGATAYVARLNEILNGIETPEEKWYRIRENIKKFLAEDKDISKSENLKKLSEEATEENTMDGYYNLLKSFRKSYDELAKLKGNEDNADKFLEKMTNVVYDKKIIC